MTDVELVSCTDRRLASQTGLAGKSWKKNAAATANDNETTREVTSTRAVLFLHEYDMLLEAMVGAIILCFS